MNQNFTSLTSTHLCRLYFIVFFCYQSIYPTLAQNSLEPSTPKLYTWEDFVQDYLTELDSDVSETQDTQELIDLLCNWHEHPLNINTLTENELRCFPFLRDDEIDDILAYLYNYGDMVSLGELDLIRSLEYEHKQMLRLFLNVKPTKTKETLSLAKMLKYGTHEGMVELRMPLYERAGYKEYSDSILARYPNRKYLGNALYHSLRYQFNAGNRIQWGMTAEKDAGEPWFYGKNKQGYDAYSIHLFLKDFGAMKVLALGDYRVSFGQGLVINNGFSSGISFQMASGGRVVSGIRRKISTSEGIFLRGVATSWALGRVLISAFGSYRKMDGTLTNDSSGISSLKTDGYHRTPLEMSKKGNTTCLVTGGDITYKKNGVTVGMTGAYTQFDRPLQPGLKIYQRYAARGAEFVNIGVHYGYLHHRLTMEGETALDKKGALATTHRLDWKVFEDWRMTILQRYFSHRYQAPWANAVATGSQVRNENGISVGLKGVPAKNINFSGYVNWSYHYWPTYQDSLSSSHSLQAYIQTVWTVSAKLSLQGRYQLKSYQIAARSPEGTKTTPYKQRHAARLQMIYRPNGCISMQSSVDFCQVNIPFEQPETGWLVSHSLAWKPRSGWMEMSGSLSFFNTTSYESRIYGYERSMWYTIPFTSYYYRGMRAAVVARMELGRRWTVMMKYGFTNYFDRDRIGSGTQEIAQSYQNDLGMQVRVRM